MGCWKVLFSTVGSILAEPCWSKRVSQSSWISVDMIFVAPRTCSRVGSSDFEELYSHWDLSEWLQGLVTRMVSSSDIVIGSGDFLTSFSSSLPFLQGIQDEVPRCDPYLSIVAYWSFSFTGVSGYSQHLIETFSHEFWVHISLLSSRVGRVCVHWYQLPLLHLQSSGAALGPPGGWKRETSSGYWDFRFLYWTLYVLVNILSPMTEQQTHQKEQRFRMLQCTKSQTYSK